MRNRIVFIFLRFKYLNLPQWRVLLKWTRLRQSRIYIDNNGTSYRCHRLINWTQGRSSNNIYRRTILPIDGFLSGIFFNVNDNDDDIIRELIGCHVVEREMKWTEKNRRKFITSLELERGTKRKARKEKNKVTAKRRNRITLKVNWPKIRQLTALNFWTW